MATIKATIFLDKRYWVGAFERTDKEGYAVARHIFGRVGVYSPIILNRT